MLTLTPAQSAEARNALGLSQAAVANETGLSRVYLSQFEGGKRILEDQWLDKLIECYEEKGWVNEAGGPDDSDQDNHYVPRVRDGFIIPDAMPDDSAESIMDRLYVTRQKRKALESERIPTFLGLPDGTAARKKVLQLGLLCRQETALVAEMQGQLDMGDAPSDETKQKVQTVAQYADYLLDKGEKEEEDF